MGLSSACRAMQRTTNAIRYIHSCRGYYLCVYVDDMVGAEVEQEAWNAFEQLGQLCSQLGIQESAEKAVAPTVCMEFLGNLLNTVDLTISVTPDRVVELQNEMEEWLRQPVTS